MKLYQPDKENEKSPYIAPLMAPNLANQPSTLF